MVLYLDLIFLINFGLTWIILKGTGLFLKRQTSWVRLLLSTLISSSTIFLVLTPVEWLLVHPISKFALSMVIVFVAFRFHTFALYFNSLFMFYMVSMVAGGTVFAFKEFVHHSPVLDQMSSSAFTSSASGHLNWSVVVASIPLVWFMLKKGNRTQRNRQSIKEKVVSLKVNIGETFIEAKALLDSGNQLKDPITKTPVMIMELSLLQQSLHPQEFEEWRSFIRSQQLGVNQETLPWSERIRIIPFRAVGVSNDWLIALRPDHVWMIEHERERKLKPMLIGLQDTKLSSNADFQMIVPADEWVQDVENPA